MIQNITFQYYPPEITKCKPIDFVSLDSFLNSIRNPKEKTKKLFENIKEAEAKGDTKTKAELKCKLYKFTPCVHINQWKTLKNITQFTGLLVLDFDHLEIDYTLKFKQVLFDECSFIIACWLSPSKHGVKALVKIPICKTVEEFKSYFLAIEKKIGHLKGFDKTAKNCVLDLFLSYDTDLLFRNDATTWDKQYFEPIKEIVYREIQEEKTDVIVNIIVKNINKITVTGHEILRATSFALGGYVGAGYISQNDAVYLINRCIEQNAYLSKKADTYKKTADTMIKKGMMQPLYFENEIVNIPHKKIITSNVPINKKVEVTNTDAEIFVHRIEQHTPEIWELIKTFDLVDSNNNEIKKII
jgi:hypothetical protein